MDIFFKKITLLKVGFKIKTRKFKEKIKPF